MFILFVYCLFVCLLSPYSSEFCPSSFSCALFVQLVLSDDPLKFHRCFDDCSQLLGMSCHQTKRYTCTLCIRSVMLSTLWKLMLQYALAALMSSLLVSLIFNVRQKPKALNVTCHPKERVLLSDPSLEEIISKMEELKLSS